MTQFDSPTRCPTRTVAVVVPLSLRTRLLPDEDLSMRHLRHFLGSYDSYVIAPAGTDAVHDGFHTVEFPRKFFGSAAAHNQLLMWTGFYRTFVDYRYILVYHLDSLVLSDQLMAWCRADWDYIGAPWIPCAETPWVKEPRVGNGGFTLMKVQSALTVLIARQRKKPLRHLTDLLARNPGLVRPILPLLESARRAGPQSRLLNRVIERWHAREDPGSHGCNNDYFWSIEAVEYFPGFTVAPVEDALRFAFEAAPRTCFEMNHHQLPFGCHAWQQFDRSFWEPHLLEAV